MGESRIDGIGAVAFDLYGTLTLDFPYDRHEQAVLAMAAALEIDGAVFRHAWLEGHPGREVGRPPTIREALMDTCIRLRRRRGTPQLEAAAGILERFLWETMVPREDALRVLASLRSQGLGLGLISNATPGAPEAWRANALSDSVDVALFSCLCGVRKPDRGIYDLAVRELGLPASRVLFVGDGASDELKGALDAGMSALLLRTSEGERQDPYGLFKEARTWVGPAVTGLDQLSVILEELSTRCPSARQ